MYGAKSKKDKKSLLKIKQESQEEEEYYEDEDNHRLVSAPPLQWDPSQPGQGLPLFLPLTPPY